MHFTRSLPGRMRNSITEFDIIWFGSLITLELFILAIYYSTSGTEPIAVRYVIYPFIWINIAIWIVVKVRPTNVAIKYRIIAASIAAVYFIILAAIAGLLGVGTLSNPQIDTGFRFVMGSPGWGPIIAYIAPTFHITIVPFLVIGYLGLAYLVYVTVIDATKMVFSGVLGVLTCVGCTMPVFASLIAGFAGGTTALTTAIYSLSIDLSTLAFVLAAALLYWRPGFNR